MSPDGGRPTWLEAEAIIAGRLLVVGAAVLAAIWLALQVRIVTAAVVLGFAEVSMLWPVARWLRRRGVPAVLAAVACVVAFSALFLLLLGFVVVRIVDSWPQLVASVTSGLQQLDAWLETAPFGIDTATLQSWIDQLQLSFSTVVASVGPAAVAALSAVSNFATVLVVATFFTVFLLTSGDDLWRRFRRTLPDDKRVPAQAALTSAMRTAGNWFYASTITGLVDGALIGLSLYLLGVPLALPIGALTFVMGYVPLVGATLAGALAVLVALLSGGIGTALWALAVVLGVQQLEGNVLSPLLLSRAISFHPAITLLLTTGAGLLFGLVGLFLAIPIAGVIVAAIGSWRRSTAPSRGSPPPQGPEGAS